MNGYRWEYEWAFVDPSPDDTRRQLALWLMDGWEPFAVTYTGGAYHTIHLRRQVYGEVTG